MGSGSILSPTLLWKDFSIKYPLQESKTSEEVFDNVIYREVYFSGREVSDGRVRIFGVFAKSRTVKKTAKTAGILILPDASETINLKFVNLYVKQGYSVLMVDYRGETEKQDNFTHYPPSVSYANYKNAKDSLFSCGDSADKTCWYEWVSVAKYALNYLKSQHDLDSIGVIGIKSGADVGWQLCATEDGIGCFVPIFSSGGRVFKGYYKNGDRDLPMNDDKLRFLAGLDASAYAQYLNCPTFYCTALNCAFTDFERAFDTFSRVPKITPLHFNLSPVYTDVVDSDTKRDVDLFFAKYLLNFKIDFPAEAKISVSVDGNRAQIVVEESDFSEHKPKKVSTFIAEGVDNPSFRNWRELKPETYEDGKQSYRYRISSSCSFVTVYSVISYRNGLTLSTKPVIKKFTELHYPKGNLLYSGKNGGILPVASLFKKAVGGVFYGGEIPNSTKICAGINGLYCTEGVVFNRFNSNNFRLSEDSLLKFDVFAEKYCKLTATVLVEENGDIKEYSFTVNEKPAIVWKDVLIRLSDFKSETRRPIGDFGSVRALKLCSDEPFVVNNMIVI